MQELERKKFVIAEKTARCGTVAKDADQTFDAASQFLSNPLILLYNGRLDDKRIVLKLTLASHLRYDWNEGVPTPQFSLPFKALENVGMAENLLADRVGFGPGASRRPIS